MLGEIFRCSDCTFEFASGWSHHSGGQHLVCRVCGEEFIAKDGASIWGPQAGEELTLYHNRYRKRIKRYQLKKTQLTITATDENSDDAPAGCFYCLTSPLLSISCPVCDQLGSIVEKLENGSRCPKCNDGVISLDGDCIY